MVGPGMMVCGGGGLALAHRSEAAAPLLPHPYQAASCRVRFVPSHWPYSCCCNRFWLLTVPLTEAVGVTAMSFPRCTVQAAPTLLPGCSTRAPRAGPAGRAEPWGAEAKEQLRKRAIGRTVEVAVEYGRKVPPGPSECGSVAGFWRGWAAAGMGEVVG